MSIADLNIEVKWFVCRQCGRVFREDEAETFTETHGFKDGPFEEFDTCPNCGCNCFEETEPPEEG